MEIKVKRFSENLLEKQFTGEHQEYLLFLAAVSIRSNCKLKFYLLGEHFRDGEILE